MPFNVLYTQDFTAADGENVGALPGLTIPYIRGSGPYIIVSGNQCSPVLTRGRIAVVAQAFAADQGARLTLTTAPVLWAKCGPAVRGQGTDDTRTCYFAHWWQNTSNYIIRREREGAETDLAITWDAGTGAPPAAAAGVVLELWAEGSDPVTLTLLVTQGGATYRGTATDTGAGVIASGAPGAYFIEPGGTLYDDLAVGETGAAPQPATELRVQQQPADAYVGEIAPTVEIVATDALGVVDTAFTGPIAVAYGLNPANAPQVYGTVTRNAVAGVATFDDLEFRTLESAGATLQASDPNAGLTSVETDPFLVTTRPQGGGAIIIVTED